MSQKIISESQEEQFEEFFLEADTDHNGFLSFEELLAVLRKNGYPGSKSDIKVMFNLMDTSGDNRISKEEFMTAMIAKPQTLHTEAYLRAVFQTFDLNGDGEVTPAEMKAAFKNMGQKISDEDIQKMVQLMDEDKSGSISYEEFIAKVNDLGLI